MYVPEFGRISTCWVYVAPETMKAEKKNVQQKIKKKIKKFLKIKKT